jgi:hypothetical protein
MIPTLDPVDLFRDAWRRSRILRVAAIVALLSVSFLLYLALRGRVHPEVALLIAVFDLGVWYFALATASAFREYRRWARGPGARQLEEAAGLLALLTIGTSQGLFLIMVLRLAAGSS